MIEHTLGNEKGAGLVEYGLIVALIVSLGIAGVTVLGDALSTTYTDVGKALAEAPAAPDDGGNAALSDDFNDDDTSQWTPLQGKWFAKGGRYGPEHEQYIDFTSSFAGDDGWTDYSVSAKGEIVKGKAMGIYFRATGTEKKASGYVFWYRPSYKTGRFMLQRMQNGKLSKKLAQVKGPKGYEWFGVERELSVRVESNTFTGYVDGEPVIQGTDDKYTSGKVGLITRGRASEAYFDDVKVVELGGKEPPKQPPKQPPKEPPKQPPKKPPQAKPSL